MPRKEFRSQEGIVNYLYAKHAGTKEALLQKPFLAEVRIVVSRVVVIWPEASMVITKIHTTSEAGHL